MDVQRNAIPSPSACPACGQVFRVVARTAAAMGTVNATDVLEWRCTVCTYREDEPRRLADGNDGDWPVSKFDNGNTGEASS